MTTRKPTERRKAEARVLKAADAYASVYDELPVPPKRLCGSGSDGAWLWSLRDLVLAVRALRRASALPGRKGRK